MPLQHGQLVQKEGATGLFTMVVLQICPGEAQDFCYREPDGNSNEGNSNPHS